MKFSPLLVAATALVALAGCNDKTSTNADAPITAEVVPPPAGGDWTKLVTTTPEGGFLMGNPNAQVKLVEYGSMTCPHCREFDEQGLKPLLENYVKKGQVSFEFRNFVRDQFDLAASLIARCGGTERFFPLTTALFADQQNWLGKVQAADQQQLQAMANLPPSQMFVQLAQVAGLQQWAAQRGLPSARSTACLANETEINKLVQMNSDAVAQFPNFPGTPTFLINGELVESTTNWATLEPKIREALR